MLRDSQSVSHIEPPSLMVILKIVYNYKLNFSKLSVGLRFAILQAKNTYSNKII